MSVFLAGGCGSDAGSTTADKAAEKVPEKAARTATSSTSIAPTKRYTVRQLAAAVGCTAKMQDQAADFRQAACVKGKDDFVFLDFDTAEGQKAWLEYAVTFGGVDLVGDRWVMSGKSKEYMETLRGTLGGTIQERQPAA